MKKQLNINAITNELRGNSAFFPRPQDASVKDDPAAVPPVPKKAAVGEPTPHAVPPVRAVPPTKKRVMKQRWPVDIYQDQYESLQELALEDRKQGGVECMSAMVREALDRLITEKRNGKK